MRMALGKMAIGFFKIILLQFLVYVWTPYHGVHYTSKVFKLWTSNEVQTILISRLYIFWEIEI